jgi:hypothetical protein
MNTNFLNSMNLTRNVTSSSVNATPFPVVLRKSARGGVGDRVLPFSLSSWARHRAAAIVPGPGAFGGLAWVHPCPCRSHPRHPLDVLGQGTEIYRSSCNPRGESGACCSTFAMNRNYFPVKQPSRNGRWYECLTCDGEPVESVNTFR